MTTIAAHTTRSIGTILTATIYNTDHVNHVSNAQNLNTDKADGVRTIAAGTGLSGGGNLTADRTLTVVFTSEAEAAAGTDTVKALNAASGMILLKRQKLQLSDQTNFSTATDTGADADDGGQFAIVGTNGASGGSFAIEVSADGGTTYATLATIANSTTQVLHVTIKGTRYTYISNGTVVGAGTLTLGAGNIFLRRAAGGSSQTTYFLRLL